MSTGDTHPTPVSLPGHVALNLRRFSSQSQETGSHKGRCMCMLGELLHTSGANTAGQDGEQSWARTLGPLDRPRTWPFRTTFSKYLPNLQLEGSWVLHGKRSQEDRRLGTLPPSLPWACTLRQQSAVVRPGQQHSCHLSPFTCFGEFCSLPRGPNSYFP